MRAAFVFAFIMLLLAVLTPVAAALMLWNDASDAIAHAAPSGVLTPSGETKPLLGAERIIAADQFGETWGGHAFPCRTLGLIWSDFTDPEARPVAMPASQRAATTLLGDRRIASARWQMRRLLVACQLEQRYNDSQLLRIWLAQASFGQNVTGLEAAARAYFAKPARALNAEQSAKLAVLLRTPGLRTQPDRWTAAAQAVLERTGWRAK
jgi:penicillin-binding protein 1A